MKTKQFDELMRECENLPSIKKLRDSITPEEQKRFYEATEAFVQKLIKSGKAFR